MIQRVKSTAGMKRSAKGGKKQVEAELHSRERYLSQLNSMTRTILLSSDFEATLGTLAVDMAKLIEADDCYITRWDDEKQLTIPTASTAKLETSYSTREASSDELSLTASVLRAGQALAVENVFDSPYLSIEIAKRYPARSVLGVPLIAGEHKLGAAIIAFNKPHHFTAEEVERSEQAGAHIALALWTFQQSTEIQHRLRESNALADIGRALSETELVGTGEVLQLIVDSVRELMPHAEKSVIHLLEADGQFLFARAVSGFDEHEKEYKRVKMRLGEGVAGQVIHEGITINIGDIGTNPHFLFGGLPPAFRSLLVAPVQKGGQRIGTISAESDRTHAFSAKDAALLNALGVQAAIAIQNTSLFESTQQRLREMDAMYKTSKGLASSLDPAELMSVPIIAVTANALKGDAEKALDAGCDVYMSKPINIRELWARVEAFVPTT